MSRRRYSVLAATGLVIFVAAAVAVGVIVATPDARSVADTAAAGEPSATQTDPLTGLPLPGPTGEQDPGATPGTTPSPGDPTTPGATSTGPVVPPAQSRSSNASTSTRSGCFAKPSACGLPDATNTGVPAGVSLTRTGSLTISRSGVYENLDVNGCITVEASNVTIRRSRIKCTSVFGIRNNTAAGNSTTNLLIEDVEVDCGHNQLTAILSHDFVARRVNIHGCENGFHIDNRATIENSYIWDFWIGRDGHTDGVQFGRASSVVLRNNTILNLEGSGTSAIESIESGMSNVLYEGNLLAGGGFTLYCPRDSSTNFRVINNRIVRGEYAYGPWVYCTRNKVAEVSGNVWDDDLTPLPN